MQETAALMSLPSNELLFLNDSYDPRNTFHPRSGVIFNSSEGILRRLAELSAFTFLQITNSSSRFMHCRPEKCSLALGVSKQISFFSV